MVHISPEIPMYALWTMRAWDFPSTEDSIITSNQCEHVNRLAAEQQAWIECPIDVAFHIGRDLQRAKLVELGRGFIGFGNFELLPEFRKRDDIGKGEDLLRRIGSAPSYDQIISKYKEDRDVERHAGAGKRRKNKDLEIDETNVDEVDNSVNELNISVELQEVVAEFDEHSSHAPPTEAAAGVPLTELSQALGATNNSASFASTELGMHRTPTSTDIPAS